LIGLNLGTSANLKRGGIILQSSELVRRKRNKFGTAGFIKMRKTGCRPKNKKEQGRKPSFRNHN